MTAVFPPPAAPPRDPGAPGTSARRLAFGPPSGPRLDRPESAAEAGPPRPVDWCAWQARVRAVAGPPGSRGRPVGARSRPRRRALAVGAVVVVLGVTGGVAGGVAGGLVGMGRGAGATAAAGAAGTRASSAEGVSATPLELVGVSPGPDPVPSPPPTAAPEPAPVPASAPVRTAAPVDRITLDLRAPDGRAMPTVVRIPEGGGPFPLVVFAHGYASSTSSYGALLDDLAAAGYVVAAPELPGTSTASPEPVGGRDPAGGVDDLRSVITAVTEQAASDGPLHGAVRDGPVAVVGHSDGGITAAATAFASRMRDPRVGAAVVLSGALGGFGGAWFPAGGPPLLAVHGDADDVNPFSSSQSLYAVDGSGAPRYLVRVSGGGHLDAFLGARTRPAVVVLIDDFLRASLGTDDGASARILDDASVPGVLDLLGS